MRSDLDKQTAAEILFFLSLILAVSIFLPACATSPEGRKQFIIVPEEQMEMMGAQAFQDIKSRQSVSKDSSVNAYVECVANSITATLETDPSKNWEVVVFSDDTANAFALPGGKIGVHTGLLKVAQTPGQLAAVIGHEVGHVLARHGNERVSEQFAAQGGLALIEGIFSSKGARYDVLMAALGLGAEFGVLLPHSRAQESEADVIGLDLMAKAGFDPQESVALWQNMEKSSQSQPPEFLSTHPSHGTRIANLQANMDDALTLYKSSDPARGPSRATCNPPQ